MHQVNTLCSDSSASCCILAQREGQNADCFLRLKYIPVVIRINFLSSLLLSCYRSHLFSLPPLGTLSDFPLFCNQSRHVYVLGGVW